VYMSQGANDLVRYVAIGTLALTCSINLVVSLQLLTNLAGKSSESNEWFSEYYPLAAAVTFLGACHVSSLLLLKSNLFGWAGFRAVFSDKELHRIKQMGLIPLFFEDLPQLAIQIYMIQVRAGERRSHAYAPTH
jgi:hypothetical protein